MQAMSARATREEKCAAAIRITGAGVDNARKPFDRALHLGRGWFRGGPQLCHQDRKIGIIELAQFRDDVRTDAVARNASRLDGARE